MTTTTTVPHDLDAEMSVLGAVLLSDVFLPALLDHGLRPEHFYRVEHEQTFAAMMTLADRDQPIDQITLAAELERVGLAGPLSPRAHVDALAGPVPAAGNAPAYADRVIDLATWRQRQTAGDALRAAAASRDPEAWDIAARAIEEPAAAKAESYSPRQWADHILDYLQQPDEDGISMPFVDLTESLEGGLRPGELLVVGGYTGDGKSIYDDQIADIAAREGKRAHLYLTEMTAAQRGLRYLARQGLPFALLRRRRLDDDLWARVRRELDQLPYGVTICSDLSIDDVCRDIRRSRWDLAVVDLIHGFSYADERELSNLSASLNRAAKGSVTGGHRGTAIVAAAHLNDGQMRDQRSPKRPKPGLHSIKGASTIKQDADFVMFVWQESDDAGLPTGTGSIWLAKDRHGSVRAVDVQLNVDRLRFELADPFPWP